MLDADSELCQTGNQIAVGALGHVDCGRYEAPWFCVQTGPKQEYLALLGISEAGFRSWLPQIAVKQTRYGKTEKVIRPLFGSYVFVQFTPSTDEWGEILRTAGVKRLFTNSSGQPAALRAGEIERLMGLGRAGDGVIDDDAPAFGHIAPGQSVRLTDGPMSGWTGVCQWSMDRRIGVLMTMFGSERVVTVGRGSAVAA